MAKEVVAARIMEMKEREEKSPSLPYALMRARGREGEKSPSPLPHMCERTRVGEGGRRGKCRRGGEIQERCDGERERERRNFLLAMEKFPSRERREESVGE